MPIVANRKSPGRGRIARAGGVASRRALPWALAAALCAGAATWLLHDGRAHSPGPPRGNAVPEDPAPALRGDTPEPDTAVRHDASLNTGDAVRHDGLSRPHDGAGPRLADAPPNAAPPDPPPAPQPEEAIAPKGIEGAQVFDNTVEEQLEAVSRQGFESIVSLRVNLPEEEILEILRRPVEIYDDDDDETVAAKERTAEMKAAALEYMESGGTFNQFLRDCQAEANEAREAVRDVQEEMKRILLERGEEAAQAYLDEQNPRLREQGLQEVHVGRGLLMMAERRRQKDALSRK